MVCSKKHFANIDVSNTEEWLQSDTCELDFQNMTYIHNFNTAAKQKGEEEGGEDKSEEEREDSEHVSHSTALQCTDALLNYMGQRGFKYSDITAVTNFHTTVIV
jgi:hypothetical protein